MGDGGLARRIPVTFATFAIATAAIAGIPPLAGFFSKDEILWFAFASGAGGSPLLRSPDTDRLWTANSRVVEGDGLGEEGG